MWIAMLQVDFTFKRQPEVFRTVASWDCQEKWKLWLAGL